MAPDHVFGPDIRKNGNIATCARPRDAALQQRQQREILHIVGHGDSGQFEECRRIVDILHHFGDAAGTARQSTSPTACGTTLVHETLVKPAVLTHVKP